MDGLRFVVDDKTGAYLRDVSGFDAQAVLAPNVIPAAEFTAPSDHAVAPLVTLDGARCRVFFRGEEQFRGLIQETPGEGPDGTVTARVVGDLQCLWSWYGRQVPTAPIVNQYQDYRTYSGPSETVFKNALRENFTRLGVPWTVAPDLGRGSQVQTQFRMHPLADKLIPLLDADNLTVVLTYIDDENGRQTGVVVDVREPDTVPGVLTLETGIPDSYTYTRQAPTMTRVVVGGRGEGVEREFIEVIHQAREAEWGMIREGFVDGRNTEEGADLTVDAYEALADGAARVGLNTTLVETARFVYGKTYQVGDLVSVDVAPVQTVQRISVAITETADEGVTVTPRIGELDETEDTDARLWRAVARLSRGIRDQGRR
ncbi:hypothetical protein AB6V29_01420 [Microbacterium sp. 20-116]|uniref:Gp37-like protein n=1 Tax=Microbacterium sp. 20-116 TaxID=3239883 RepID=UPI0034E1EFA3